MMLYLKHFGLKENPFTLTPDIDFYYPTQDNEHIVEAIEIALKDDAGIIKVVGDVGTGKTLLCRLLMQRLFDTQCVAYINAPNSNAAAILRAVCDEFGIEHSAEEGDSHKKLNEFLLKQHGEGKLCVVVVDEAQHLGQEGLEAVRLISNIETEKRKLLQIVLFGQTELDDLLKQNSLRQLYQRIVFAFNTNPLTESEASKYVEHRIRISRVDGVGYPIFSEPALKTIARAARGVPRLVNILSSKALMSAYGDQSPKVELLHVQQAVKDTPAAGGSIKAPWYGWFLRLVGQGAH